VSLQYELPYLIGSGALLAGLLSTLLPRRSFYSN